MRRLPSRKTMRELSGTTWKKRQNKDALHSEPMVSRKNLPPAEKKRIFEEIKHIQQQWAERQKRKQAQ